MFDSFCFSCYFIMPRGQLISSKFHYCELYMDAPTIEIHSFETFYTYQSITLSKVSPAVYQYQDGVKKLTLSIFRHFWSRHSSAAPSKRHFERLFFHCTASNKKKGWTEILSKEFIFHALEESLAESYSNISNLTFQLTDNPRSS
jgi:hypothetical protein